MKRHSYKAEAEEWRLLAHIQSLAVLAVANDKHYECQCGTGEYTDGCYCPKCFCFVASEEMKELRKRFSKKYKQRKRKNG